MIMDLGIGLKVGLISLFNGISIHIEEWKWFYLTRSFSVLSPKSIGQNVNVIV